MTLEFIGRYELKSTKKKKDGTVISFKGNDGEDVKVYRVEFSTGGQYNQKLDMFSNSPGVDLLTEDNEGKNFKISFRFGKSYTTSHGNTIHPKVVTKLELTDIQEFSYPPKFEDVQTTLPKDDAPMEKMGNNALGFNDEVAKHLIEEYFKLVKAEDQNVNHFIGTMIKSLNLKLVKPLIEEFDKRQAQ